jgi:pimeloyl-ACP methyl ester carboxylesterase
MREERVEADGIPAKVYDPGAATGLLLFGHGGGASKDDDRVVDLGRRYADGTGLAVVCIDAVDHGERRRPVITPDDVDEPWSDDPRDLVPPNWHADSAPLMVADWQKTAEALSSIGPAVAYVGLSMGMIFGAPTVAAMPSIKAAVFGVGGAQGPTAFPGLRTLLLDAATHITEAQVLMLNMTKDEVFSTEGTHAFFDAIPGRKKRLMFWEGDHIGLPAESTRLAIDFINRYTAS